MTEENTQSTETQSFGWVAGVPVGMQDHPDTRRSIEERRKLYQQQQESQSSSESSDPS
jgi:hypothetical protein